MEQRVLSFSVLIYRFQSSKHNLVMLHHSWRDPCSIVITARTRHTSSRYHLCLQQSPQGSSRDHKTDIHPYRYQ